MTNEFVEIHTSPSKLMLGLSVVFILIFIIATAMVLSSWPVGFKAWEAFFSGLTLIDVFTYYFILGIVRLVVPPVLVIDHDGFRIVTKLFPQTVAWGQLEALQVRLPRSSSPRAIRRCYYKVGGQWTSLGNGWRETPEQILDMLSQRWAQARMVQSKHPVACEPLKV